MAMIYSIN